MNSYLIVIPAYNEETNIGRVISDCKKAVPFADILTVNDGSSDNTSTISEQSGAMLLDLTNNLGYGSAIQSGFQFAAEHGYKYVITIDGDGQHDPYSVMNLIRMMSEKNANVVIGSRFINGTYKMEAARKIGSWIFSMVASGYTKTRFTDPTSGFQLLDQKAFSYLSESNNYPMDYPDVNAIMFLYNAGFKIIEAPVQMFRKPGGKSIHSGLTPVFYVMRMMLAIFLQFIRKGK